MGYVDCQSLSYVLPDGRVLFADASFRVGDGTKTALVGANGTGKTTLLRIVAGDLRPSEGAVARDGGLGVMRQFIGMIADDRTLADLALSLATPPVRAAGERLAAAERRVASVPADVDAQLRYGDALTVWGEAGGYDAEVLFDTVSVAVLDLPWERARQRRVATLSGGEQKRFALELLLRGTDEVLLLDEPDNFLDVPAKRWLEGRLAGSGKSVLYVSHDRELLARTADRVVTVEGGSAWVHPAGFASWHEARLARHDKLESGRRRWDEEREKLRTQMLMYKQKAAYNSGMASRYQAAMTRLRKFEQDGPPPLPPREQDVRMRLSGGRTGKRAVICEGLELEGLTYPFDLEIWFGDRVAVLSPSWAAPGFAPEVHEQAMRRLEELTGLVPVEYPTTRQLGASPRERARDLNAAFADPSIRAVLATVGGEDQITVVAHLDAEAVRADPKPFLGYSDNTNLLSWLWTLGVAGFYGGSTQVHLGAGPLVDHVHLASLRAQLAAFQAHLSAATAEA